MLRRHDQYAVSREDVVLETRNFSREIGLKVLVEHWQIVDTNEFSFELAAGEFHQRLGELSVDRLAPVGANNDCDFREGCRNNHFALSSKENLIGST
jgi:hypothetical protein